MAKTKLCYKCQQQKSLDKFYQDRSKKGGLSNMCIVCHTKRNKEKFQQRTKWFRAYKKTLQCEICGDNRFYILDFHHKNPNEKEYRSIRTKFQCSVETILKELSKRQVLCANCHREVHWKMKQGVDLNGDSS